MQSSGAPGYAVESLSSQSPAHASTPSPSTSISLARDRARARIVEAVAQLRACQDTTSAGCRHSRLHPEHAVGIDVHLGRPGRRRRSIVEAVAELRGARIRRVGSLSSQSPAHNETPSLSTSTSSAGTAPAHVLSRPSQSSGAPGYEVGWLSSQFCASGARRRYLDVHPSAGTAPAHVLSRPSAGFGSARVDGCVRKPSQSRCRRHRRRPGIRRTLCLRRFPRCRRRRPHHQVHAAVAVHIPPCRRHEVPKVSAFLELIPPSIGRLEPRCRPQVQIRPASRSFPRACRPKPHHHVSYRRAKTYVPADDTNS